MLDLKLFPSVLFYCNRLWLQFNRLHVVVYGFFWLYVLFCRLLYILIDYKGLRGSFIGIFNRLHLCFNQLLILAFVLGENKGQFNWLLCCSNRLLACFFVCNPLHIFIFTSSTTIITASPPTSANQNDSASLYKPTQTYPQITLTPLLKPPVTTPLWTQAFYTLKPFVSFSRWQIILQEHSRKQKLPRGSKKNAHRLLSTI